jgi:predicted phosphodiesterase
LPVVLILSSLSSCGRGKAAPEDESQVQDPTDYTFVVCGDPHGLSPQFKQIVEVAKGADFLVVVGDLTTSGSDAELKKMYDYLQASGVEYYAIRGDNDRSRDPSGAGFSRYFGPLWRSFDYQNSHFQLLDDSDAMKGYPAEELAWMEEDLATTGAPLKFAFAHIPPGAPPDLSSDYDAWEGARDTSDQAMEMWQRSGVDTVFSGHLHAYTVYRADDPRILVTGGAGATLHLPEAMGGYYNYLLVHVQGRNVDVQVVKLQ